MNWDVIARSGPQFDAALKRQWPELRDDQIRSVAGRRAWLADSLQESYCLPRELAELEIDAWIATFGDAEPGEIADPPNSEDTVMWSAHRRALAAALQDSQARL